MRRSHELPEEIHGAFLRRASKSIQYELPLISKAFSNMICLGCKSGSAWWSRSIGNIRKLKPPQTYCFHLFHRVLLFKGPPPLFLQVSAADYCKTWCLQLVLSFVEGLTLMASERGSLGVFIKELRSVPSVYSICVCMSVPYWLVTLTHCTDANW